MHVSKSQSKPCFKSHGPSSFMSLEGLFSQAQGVVSIKPNLIFESSSGFRTSSFQVLLNCKVSCLGSTKNRKAATLGFLTLDLHYCIIYATQVVLYVKERVGPQRQSVQEHHPTSPPITALIIKIKEINK